MFYALEEILSSEKLKKQLRASVTFITPKDSSHQPLTLLKIALLTRCLLHCVIKLSIPIGKIHSHFIIHEFKELKTKMLFRIRILLAIVSLAQRS